MDAMNEYSFVHGARATKPLGSFHPFCLPCLVPGERGYSSTVRAGGS